MKNISFLPNNAKKLLEGPISIIIKGIKNILEGPLNIDPSKAGKTLLGLNALGMAAAAASDTFAAAVDKNTSAEDKKFLIPAGIVTGIAKIGIYFTMTTAIINKLQGKVKYNEDGSVKKVIKGVADDALEIMEQNKTFDDNAIKYTNKVIKKAESGFLGTGLFKKSDKYIADMKATLKDGDNITEAAKNLFKSNFKSGFGVLGAFIGAIVGSAFLTPIIRDTGAWAIQKRRENNNPKIQDTSYNPYFATEETKNSEYSTKKQPLSMQNYMTYTHSGSLKV